MKLKIPPWNKMLLSIDEAIALTGVGREQFNEWRLNPDFPSFKAGMGERGNCKIHREKLDEWLARRAEMRVGER